MLILHLSDIHFRKMEVETAQDPNSFIRNEIKRDAVTQCKSLGRPEVILISGDIAFAGHPDEFDYATAWLRELSEACGSSLDKVFVCPGNHDVVRSQANRNMVQHVHNAIKAAGNPTAYISGQFRDPDARRLLYESLDNYNAFAFQFFCDLLAPERTIAKRDVPLNDGSILRFWGLNTAFVSSSSDRQGDLFVDEASFQIPREDGVVNLAVAHHHLSWLRQSQELEDHLNDVAAIQVFGHVHTNRIAREVEYIRLTASAMHPEREEAPYEPGYNLLDVTVEGTGDNRYLRIAAHVRVWQNAPGGFRAKQVRGSDVWTHSIKLEPWTRPVNAPPTKVVLDAPNGSLGTLPEEASAMNQLRKVGLRFYQLSFSKKSEIAGRFGLLEDEDINQPDYERFRRVFQRAHQRGLIDDLAEAIRNAEKT
ncbi:metallophosphoesterase [Xylophilus rhododendri]|uniref:Metallophosphoesterase n=1 Tax=Xylophilus rhododendri TaxID=2697032 RepID=A0A857J475_9BURK|nr:metallophosphoesterase [Xylophilus rhododendri]QHI98457.1 metallophosphoesterase [Xylophilus rhododendri]